jgi:hypothetical protein
MPVRIGSYGHRLVHHSWANQPAIAHTDGRRGGFLPKRLPLGLDCQVEQADTLRDLAFAHRLDRPVESSEAFPGSAVRSAIAPEM